MFDLESEVKKESLNYFNAQVRVAELERELRLLLEFWDSRHSMVYAGAFRDEMEVARSLLEKTYEVHSIPPIAHAVPPTTGG